MAQRKLQQEVDKCFKKVAEGVAEFDSIYEKIEQSNNPSQKEKLEDTLKREIKKLQRLRDQIKTWAAGNDIKDKGPLLEQRKLIESQMERFKAVEKAMKTKAYSKEGLSAAAKLDPKEQAKMEASDFLSSQVDELEQQIEALEAESEGLQATMKKGKLKSANADRMAEIERIIERHKWHQGKMELIRRSLENGGVEAEQVTELDESIRYYVTDNQNDDFMEDDTMYDDLNLDVDEDNFGMNQENDRVSSQDAQSVQDEAEPESRPTSIPVAKARAQDPTGPAGVGRRPSAQLKSPLPSLATLHTPISTNGIQANSSIKPAPIPQRPAEGLKYASAAAAAAASDKIGIAPLPPPPGAAPVNTAGPSTLPQAQSRTSAANSPSVAPIQPTAAPVQPPVEKPAPAPTPSRSAKNENSKSSKAAGKAPAQPVSMPEPVESSKAPHVNGSTNGFKPAPIIEEDSEEESIYHLPASLQDLVDTFEITKKRPLQPGSALTHHMLAQSQKTLPDSSDSEAPRIYHPESRYMSTSNYPAEPLGILEDPRLYGRVDSDTLFYVFYYKQGTYQQYLAAKALKDMSWRFHKQYQTWFQRHEEPKSITEEFEQGTYRFFDYESTWMNRRKADFKFAYKFLEDDV